jgi:hypothetical protein
LMPAKQRAHGELIAPKLFRSSMMEKHPREIAKGPPIAVLMGCGGLQGVRAGSYRCGGETASDDVPIGETSQYQFADRTVRRNTRRKKRPFSRATTLPPQQAGEGRLQLQLSH